MTTTATINETSRSSRMPSARAFHIFRLAEIQGQTHKQIAELYKVSRRRISQIVERVRSWLAQHPCEDPQIATELQAKRLGQHLEQMRLEVIIQRAREQLTYAKPTLDTVIDKADGTKTIICREQPFNVQLLKTYLRAVEALGRINARPEIPLPPPPEGAFPWLSNAINEVYEKWYHKICAKQNLKPDLFCNFVDELEAEMLKAAKHQQELAARPPAEAVDPHSCAARHLELPADLPPSDLDDDSVGPRDAGTAAQRWSAGDSALCGVPRAGSELDQTADTQARSASEGPGCNNGLNFDSLPTSGSGPSTLDLGPGTLDCESTASLAATPSQREALPAQQLLPEDEPPTPVATETSAPSSSAETAPPTAPPSQKNPKREAPPQSISPSSYPSVAPSAIPAADY